MVVVQCTDMADDGAAAKLSPDRSRPFGVAAVRSAGIENGLNGTSGLPAQARGDILRHADQFRCPLVCDRIDNTGRDGVRYPTGNQVGRAAQHLLDQCPICGTRLVHMNDASTRNRQVSCQRMRDRKACNAGAFGTAAQFRFRAAHHSLCHAHGSQALGQIQRLPLAAAEAVGEIDMRDMHRCQFQYSTPALITPKRSFKDCFKPSAGNTRHSSGQAMSQLPMPCGA